MIVTTIIQLSQENAFHVLQLVLLVKMEQIIVKFVLRMHFEDLMDNVLITAPLDIMQ